MNIARRTFVLAVLSLAAALRAQLPPGYDGTFPSERAQQALRDAMATPWEDTKNVAGGGTWKLERGGVTPHALGPCRGDVMEMRTAETKGPHLRVVRDHLAICLPTTTDGDVAATLRWLGRPVPDGVTGEPTASWKLAAARVAALGPEVAGMRIGLVATDRPRHVELFVWKVGADQEPFTGKATLEIAGTTLPLRFLWPAKQDADAATSALRLKSGSTFVEALDVDALLAAAGEPELAPGEHEARVTFTAAGGASPAFELRTLALVVEVGKVAKAVKEETRRG